MAKATRQRILSFALLVAGVLVLLLHVFPKAWRSVNTDFPNYYVTARLIYEGRATDRVYEWQWFAQQKDRFNVPYPVAGFIPHTPFSALMLVPLAHFEALTAKRLWIVANLCMMALTLLLIRSITGASAVWIACALLFSVPFYRNLEYGQYYVLLLLLLTASLWAYLRGNSVQSGVLVAVAAGLKIFPALLLLFFLRKRDWRAVAGFSAGATGVALVSCAVFGTTTLVRFLTQILPSAMRGEAMNPYALQANSISALLHHLFIFEPQLNAAPVAHAPWLVAVLSPVLQVVVLVPAVLLCSRDREAERIKLEWSALLTATLAISTLPSSYHFVLLLLPLLIGASRYFNLGNRNAAILIVTLSLGIGFPLWPQLSEGGWHALLDVPRLWLVLAFDLLLIRPLARNFRMLSSDWAWIAAFCLLCTVQIATQLHHERNLYDSQQWMLPLPESVYSVASPREEEAGLAFEGMTIDGWQTLRLGSLGLIRAPKLESVRANGEKPLFLRDDKSGRMSLWNRDTTTGAETRLTPAQYDVYEIDVGQHDSVFFSATHGTLEPRVFRLDASGAIVPYIKEASRWPTLSPDGRWLAYATLRGGVWRLKLRDILTSQERNFPSADCNEFPSSWTHDGQLLYSSDCGRGLWQTALYKRPM